MSPDTPFIEEKVMADTNDLRNKKAYMVTLEMQIGEYSKDSKHLVEAYDEDEAEKAAYASEQHEDDAEWDEDLQAFVDCNGEMIYRVVEVNEVPWEDAVVLRKYL